MIENFGDKINTKGLDKMPQNINKNGRPVSIRAQLKDLLESDGNVTMPSSQVVKINDDGSVVLKLPTQMQLAMKLSSWAMSKKGNDSLKAIQMIMEQIDGKPKQEISGGLLLGVDAEDEDEEYK
ncbi:MAG: hypothetical protein KDD03_00985 [Gelidibacter sp.]|nr:hypothetical protein [Gelidibacter sp.]